MTTEITGVHHVGHVVRDIAAALVLYRRLGFVVPAPSYPAIPTRNGAELEPFGAANTHADFARGFIELATVVRADGQIPADARLVPLQAPPDALPVLRKRINATSATLAECLERFEGLHILMFSSSDIDTTAERLTRAGVGHGGVNTLRRPVGDEVETVRYLEIDGVRQGAVAEGRVGVVADLDPRIQTTRQADHPNGALDVVDCMLCVADGELDAAQARYESYLGKPARLDGQARVFDLDAATLTLVSNAGMGTLLPGQHAPGLPAVVACTVAVSDLARTRNLLRDNGLTLQETAYGDVLVPGGAVLGAAIAFRQAGRTAGVASSVQPCGRSGAGEGGSLP